MRLLSNGVKAKGQQEQRERERERDKGKDRSRRANEQTGQQERIGIVIHDFAFWLWLCTSEQSGRPRFSMKTAGCILLIALAAANLVRRRRLR